MSSKANIRPMCAADIASIASWVVKAPLWQRYGFSIEGITSQFQKALAEQALIYVTEHEVVSGFAWYIPQGAFARSPYLKLIGVHPQYRNMEIGKQLLSHVEADCKRFSKQLFLLVSDFNIAAQRFYQRQGYQHIGTIPAYVLPDVAELIYYKRLDT